MNRMERKGQCGELRIRRKNIEAEITSHKDSILASLPPIGKLEDIDGEYVMMLAIKIHELVQELRKVNRNIEILERDL